jgi:hypothetical protein
MTIILWALLMAGQLVDGHVHAAPHGGVIAHAGPYHLESVVDEKRIEVWLLDQNMKPVPAAGHRLAATLRFVQPDRAARSVPFTVEGDHFAAPVDLTGLPSMNVEMRLDPGKKLARAAFRWQAIDSRQRLEDSVDP